MNRSRRLNRYFFGVSTQNYSRVTTLALLMPLLLLLVGAFVYPIALFLGLGIFDPEPTFAHFQLILDRPFFATVLIRTFRTAAVVMVGTLILGYPVAYFMATLHGVKATLVAAVVVLPLWISVLVRTYVWTIFLGRQGIINEVALGLGFIDQPIQFLNTEFAVWVAMIHILLPMMILPIHSSLRGIPRELAMAAEGLGASPAAVLREVILPLSLPGVAAGCVLVFIISLGYFITPMLLGGPRSMLIGNLITEQATRFLDWPLASALSTVLMGATLIIIFVFNRVLRLDRVLGTG
jgi:ABC-type spermidine/putrescine transport system permease subunit I